MVNVLIKQEKAYFYTYWKINYSRWQEIKSWSFWYQISLYCYEKCQFFPFFNPSVIKKTQKLGLYFYFNLCKIKLAYNKKVQHKLRGWDLGCQLLDHRIDRFESSEPAQSVRHMLDISFSHLLVTTLYVQYMQNCCKNPSSIPHCRSLP